MKIVTVQKGYFDGRIESLRFLSEDGTVFSVDLSNITNIRKSANKIIVTYESDLISNDLGKARLIAIQILCNNIELYLASRSNPLLTSAGLDLSDIHIYNTENKDEIIIISKETILTAMKEYKSVGVYS